MDIKWNIDTGYVTRIPDFRYEIAECELDDLAFELSNGATEEEIGEELGKIIQEEFEQRVLFFITNIEEIIAEARRRAEKYKEE